jgi:hypothetical protein
LGRKLVVLGGGDLGGGGMNGRTQVEKKIGERVRWQIAVVWISVGG